MKHTDSVEDKESGIESVKESERKSQKRKLHGKREKCIEYQIVI